MFTPGRTKASLLFVFAISAILVSCDIADRDNGPQHRFLTGYTLVGELSTEQIIENYDNPVVELIVSHSVKAYRITYRTKTVSGSGITASGLILVPVTEAPSVLVLQRGTLFRKSEAPSLFDPNLADGNSAWTYFGPPVSSSGYIIIMPDLLGFGASEQVFHPYFVTRSHGRVSLDMMRAAEEFFDQGEIMHSGRLFLSGYSQGATSAMALMKLIEEEAASEFDVTAVSIGGGGYNLVDLSKNVLSSDTLGYPPYYAYMMAAYDQTYNLNRPMDTVFKPPYSNRIYGENLFSGLLSGQQIADRLTDVTADLFQESFLNSFLGNGEQVLKDLLDENDVSRFATDVPIRMYHGELDEAVPFDEAFRSYENLQQAGTPDIQFFVISGGGHQSSAIDFASLSLNWFFTF